MARQTWTSGQTLTAAQMTTLQESVWSDDVNAQTGTTYTLVLTDAGKQVTFTNAAAITVTVPTNATVAFATGVRIWLLNIGTSVVTIAAAGGVTLRSPAGDLTIPAYGTAQLIKTASDTWQVIYAVDPDDDQAVIATQVFS